MSRTKETTYDLWMASRKYTNGDISIEELEKVERNYTEKLCEALVILSHQDAKRDVKEKAQRLIRLSHLLTFWRNKSIFLSILF